MHKGQRPIPIKLDHWHSKHPVARTIATGSHWFDAWLCQNATPLYRLEALTGIPQRRFMAMLEGDSISRAEIDALARAWSISSNDLIASIGGRSKIID